MRYPAFTGTEPCTEFHTDMYYPNSSQANELEYRAIRDACNGCGMQEPCLEWGLRHETHGVWGGVNPVGRERIRKERGISFSDPALPMWGFTGTRREAS